VRASQVNGWRPHMNGNRLRFGHTRVGDEVLVTDG